MVQWGALVVWFVANRKKEGEEESAEVELRDEDFFDAPTTPMSVVSSLKGSAMEVSPSLVDFGFREGRQAPIGVPQKATVVLTNHSKTWVTFQVVVPQSNKYALRVSIPNNSVPAGGRVSIGLARLYFLFQPQSSPLLSQTILSSHVHFFLDA